MIVCENQVLQPSYPFGYLNSFSFTMSTSGHEDEYDQEAAAAAQREDFAELRSWTVWGAIKRDSTARTTGKRKKNLILEDSL